MGGGGIDPCPRAATTAADQLGSFCVSGQVRSDRVGSDCVRLAYYDMQQKLSLLSFRQFHT